MLDNSRGRVLVNTHRGLLYGHHLPSIPPYLLVLGQALLDISQFFAIPHNLLLNGMLIYVDSLTLQVSYE